MEDTTTTENSDDPGDYDSKLIGFLERAFALSIVDDCWGAFHADWVSGWLHNNRLGRSKNVYSDNAN